MGWRRASAASLHLEAIMKQLATLLLSALAVAALATVADGNIATGAVAAAPADGHTLLLTGNNHAVNATLLPNPGFDYVKSFAPIAMVATSNMLLVASPTLQAANVADLLRQAHEKPGA